MVLAAAPLAWRRRAPLLVATIVSAAVATGSLLGYWPEFVAPLWVAVYSAAAYCERARLVRVLLPLSVVTSVAISIGERWDRGLNWVEVLIRRSSSRSASRCCSAAMTFNRRRRIERDRELAAREAVVAERARIARELHDVVAHSMSVMVVQAGAARAVGRRRTRAAATEALRADRGDRPRPASRRCGGCSGSSRPTTGETAVAPQPGLAELDELLDAMRAAGLPVEAMVEGDPRAAARPASTCPRTASIQEALTNTLQHAGEAHARVVRAVPAGRARARGRRRRPRTAPATRRHPAATA